jgi:hypothetical protein
MVLATGNLGRRVQRRCKKMDQTNKTCEEKHEPEVQEAEWRSHQEEKKKLKTRESWKCRG